MLDDKMFYKRITDKRRNPNTKTELELEKILKDLKRSGNLTEKEYWQLKPFDSSRQHFMVCQKYIKYLLYVMMITSHLIMKRTIGFHYAQ